MRAHLLKIDVPHDEMRLFAIPFLQGGHIKTPAARHRASKLSITSMPKLKPPRYLPTATAGVRRKIPENLIF